jgi:aspartate-semialdehyde dehydrogenase
LTAPIELALLGADAPLGEAVLRLIEERELPVGQLHALTLDAEDDGNTSFRDKLWPNLDAESFDYSRISVLVVADSSQAAARLVGNLQTRYPQLPVLHCEALDPAPAIAVARVLKVLKALTTVERIDAFAALPSSMAGRAGIEELARQSRGLFNMETPDPEVFPLQIAFNLLPRLANLDGYSHRLSTATRRLSEVAHATWSVIWAPLFYASAVALHVRVSRDAELEALRGALRRADGMTLMEADLAAAVPTPATDAQDSEDVFVSGIDLDEEVVRFWLVFDPARLEAASIVAKLENWIEIPAISMLT